MKKTFCAVCVTAISLTLTALSPAEEIVRTTTDTISGGTITEFLPSETVVVQSETAAPVRYSVTRETTFVDEAGVPVAVERIRRGVPVTVQYIREGDRSLASRVIVHQEAPMTKARAKALREYYDKLADHSEGREKANAKAMKEYYDKLEDHLKD
jgi:hypothetical protein